MAQLACAELEVWNVQDLHVLSKAPLPDESSWERPAFVRGQVVDAGRPSAQTVAIGGHASLARGLGVIEGIELHVEGLGAFGARH